MYIQNDTLIIFVVYSLPVLLLLREPYIYAYIHIHFGSDLDKVLLLHFEPCDGSISPNITLTLESIGLFNSL